MSRYLILLSLLKHAGYIYGRVQFQKLLFLLEKNYGMKTGYHFVPFKYGPFCAEIQTDIRHLIEYGYVEHREEERGEGEIVNKYAITEYGEEYLLENGVENQLYNQVIQDLCYDFKNYSLRQLIEYVYENYPEYIVKSEVREKYYNPQPKLKDFTPANNLIGEKTKPIIPPTIVDWLDEEIENTKKRLGIKETEIEEGKDFEADEVIVAMLEIAFEDVGVQAQEISTSLTLENYDEAGEINNQIYYVLEILENLLTSLEEGDLITVYTEFSNAKTNLKMLENKVALHKTSLKSELVREIGIFVDDVDYLLDSTDKIISL